MQMRTGAGGVPYAPHRDIANVFLHAVKEALYLLRPDKRSPVFNELMVTHGISEEELGEAAKKLGISLMAFVGEGEIKSLDDALRLGGFDSVRPETAMAINARIGEVMVAGYFYAIREAKLKELPPPIGVNLGVVFAAAAAWLSPGPSEFDTEADRNMVVQSLRADLRECNRWSDVMRREIDALKTENAKLLQELNRDIS